MDKEPRLLVAKMNPLKTLLIFVWGCVLSLTTSPIANAQGHSQTESNQAPSEQIQITADRLESSQKAGFVEFIGRVEAIQGQFQIRSDRLRVYYADNVSADGPVTDTDAIKRIVATGNVDIQTDSAKARTDRAEYIVAETLLLLTGDNSTVTDDKNLITGSKISLNRTTGDITVEGKPGKRVKAVFYPDEELDLNPEAEQSKP